MAAVTTIQPVSALISAALLCLSVAGIAALSSERERSFLVEYPLLIFVFCSGIFGWMLMMGSLGSDVGSKLPL